MPDEKGNIYPQQVLEQGVGKEGACSGLKGPDFFKFGNNITFMRPGKVTASMSEEGKISLQCETRGFLNRVVQTHETQMHQFSESENVRGCLHLQIDFWSDSIFRIRFSKEAIDEREADFPPKERRMLVGKPEKKINLRYEDTQDIIRVSTSQIQLEIDKQHFCMKAYGPEGKLFWEQYRTDLFTSDIFDLSVSENQGRTACFESFALRAQEEIFGLGERFDHVARRGKSVDFWNKDAIGTSNRRTYINVPFLLSTQGYGMFLNSSCRTEWEIGTLEAFTLGFSVEDTMMDYFILYGPTPADILYKYSTLTGFSPVPPLWSFGLWMSRNSYLSWDVVHEVADRMREKDIPADVLHLDTAWFKEDWNCDLKFSEERFPDPEGHMKKLREKGFRVSLWQYNFIPPRANNDHYREALEKGYLVLGKDGKPYRYAEGTIGSWIDDTVIDFSNEEACTWYAEKIRALMRLGAAAVKTDFGEGIPEDGIFKSIDGRKFHNLYSLVYNSVVAEAIESVTGEHVVWARSGTAGSQRYPIHWGGDSQCSFAGLAGTLRAALSIGLSGFPYFSHDIGGFIGRPSPELYVRWAQLGLFSSHSRCHGAGDDNSREPWTFGENAERIFRKYAKLRYTLLPYIYNEAIKCSKSAKPMVRALLVDYPQDRNVWHIEDQYLFGDSLLIAPVLEPLAVSRMRKLYLPEGKWVDYWTKEIVPSNGRWIEREVDLETMPIYVKENSILCYGPEKSHTNNEIGAVSRIEVYGCRKGTFEFNDAVSSYSIEADDSGIRAGWEFVPDVVYFGG